MIAVLLGAVFLHFVWGMCDLGGDLGVTGCSRVGVYGADLCVVCCLTLLDVKKEKRRRRLLMTLAGCLSGWLNGMSGLFYVSASSLTGVWHGYAGYWLGGSRDSSKRAFGFCCEAGLGVM